MEVPIASFPIIQFARKIGKNTAELTATDLARFTREWVKQPQRKDILNMGKKIVSKKAAIVNGTKSMKRFIPQAEVEVDEPAELEQDQLGEEEGVEMMSGEEEAQMNQGTDIDPGAIVADMTLTQIQVDSLVWAIGTIFEQFDLSQMSDVESALTELHNDLEPLATQGE